MDYGYRKKLSISFEDAIAKVTDALKEEGFGILTEIDVKKTLKEKINIDFKQYTILGACNPPRAHHALQSEEEIGLLLPCNVIVYEKDDSVVVSALMPSVAFSIVDNKKLEPLAEEVESMLKKVINSL